MVDITHKQDTLRTAIASAIFRVSLPETIERVVNKTVPKGDVFEFARAAGLLGIKKTSDMIPDCFTRRKRGQVGSCHCGTNAETGDR